MQSSVFVLRGRFELPTPGSSDQCSNQLSYLSKLSYSTFFPLFFNVYTAVDNLPESYIIKVMLNTNQKLIWSSFASCGLLSDLP